jgi:hypothetical protein
MTHIKLAISVVIGITILTFSFNAPQAAGKDPLEAIKTCARTVDADERIACYEDLGKRVLDEEAAATARPMVETPVAASAATVGAAASAETPPVETVAAGNSMDTSVDEKKKPIPGHVRSCQQASDKRWFFVLDNGDVWKQSGGTIRRFSDCDFDVVIRKDLFGHKMSIEGDDKTIRVRRHK